MRKLMGHLDLQHWIDRCRTLAHMSPQQELNPRSLRCTSWKVLSLTTASPSCINHFCKTFLATWVDQISGDLGKMMMLVLLFLPNSSLLRIFMFYSRWSDEKTLNAKISHSFPGIHDSIIWRQNNRSCCYIFVQSNGELNVMNIKNFLGRIIKLLLYYLSGCSESIRWYAVLQNGSGKILIRTLS